MQQACKLNPRYKHGLDGSGQNVVIVDAFGSNSITGDANLFASLNGLPQLTPSTFAIFTPNGSATCFVSALFQSPASTRWDVFTFGTDSSLTTGDGWDNVTGLGTPNGMPFINAVVKADK